MNKYNSLIDGMNHTEFVRAELQFIAVQSQKCCAAHITTANQKVKDQIALV